VDVFRDIESKEYQVSEGPIRFSRYDLSQVEFSQGSASQAALDFITGLRQFREEQKKT
jgi:hypothetical protein